MLSVLLPLKAGTVRRARREHWTAGLHRGAVRKSRGNNELWCSGLAGPVAIIWTSQTPGSGPNTGTGMSTNSSAVNCTRSSTLTTRACAKCRKQQQCTHKMFSWNSGNIRGAVDGTVAHWSKYLQCKSGQEIPSGYSLEYGLIGDLHSHVTHAACGKRRCSLTIAQELTP